MSKFVVTLLFSMASVGFASNSFVRSFFPKNFFWEANGKVFYNSYSLKTGVELAVLEPNKDVKIFDLFSGINSSSPREFISIGSSIFFTANSPEFGFELWSYVDPFGPRLYKDIYPGKKGSFPTYFTTCNGKLFFTADLLNMGRELVVLDPSTGAMSFFDHEPGPTSSYPLRLTCFGNKLFYVVKDVLKNKGIFSLDGNQKATFEYQLPGGSVPELINIDNKYLFFKTTESLYRYEAPGKVATKDYLTIMDVPQEIIIRSILGRIQHERSCGKSYEQAALEISLAGADVLDNIVSSSNLWGIQERQERRNCKFSNPNKYLFNYLFRVGEKLYIQRGYAFVVLDIHTGQIYPVMNDRNLKLKEFYPVVKLGEINFTKARRIDDGKIIEIYFKNDEVFEYGGPGSMYDLIYFKDNYYYRDSMLAGKLHKIEL